MSALWCYVRSDRPSKTLPRPRKFTEGAERDLSKIDVIRRHKRDSELRAMRATQFIRHIPLSIMTALSLLVLPARAEAAEYDKFGEWSILYVDAVSSNSCSAFTTFTDQTVIQLALVQTPPQVAWAVFLSNEKWKSMFAARAQVTLSLLTSKSWSSTFSVTTSSAGDKAVLASPVPTAFITSIVDAQALFILDDKNKPLTGSFNMTDSGRAIAAVERCVRDHPLTAAPRPAPSG